MPGKLNLEHLTLEEKEKLKEYISSLKEIKKEINKMINRGSNNTKVDEKRMGGNKSTGLHLNL